MNGSAGRRACASILGVALLCACHSPAAVREPRSADLPAFLLGDFMDDYGGRFTISATEWVQHPTNRYRIVKWNVSAQYLIAQNDAANASAPGLWTRIDWLQLPARAPYTWGFCFTAYEARSATEAEVTTSAQRDTPRTGCNGFPFSRMRSAR
ncbi:MAG: hypothetical protein ACRENP_11790 [Longimicrobiales bacterium]